VALLAPPVGETILLAALDSTVIAALVAAGVALVTTLVAAPLRLQVENRLLSRRLQLEYEYEQRKELRNLIGRYHGRLLAASEAWHYRLGNLYENVDEGWLAHPSEYYFLTTCHRFLSVCSLVRSFEREAFYIDARIAEDRDLDFLNYTRAFTWVVTDTALFRNLGYEPSFSVDHFFADQLRWISDSFSPQDDECLAYQDFVRITETKPHPFEDVFEFFQGLRPGEHRLRWDRMVSFHLLLMAFINTVGYETQASDDDYMEAVARQLEHREIAESLNWWLGRLGLSNQQEGIRVARALAARMKVSAEK
jgi:hypothetical protein